MRETDELRKKLEHSPKQRLAWAKQFRFLEWDRQHLCSEYNEKALLAYQVLNQVANQDIEQVADWALSRWECGAICINQTFGNNAVVEWTNVYEFANHLVNTTIKRFPMTISPWITASFNRGGHYDQVVRDWLYYAFEQDRSLACQVLFEICARHSHKLRVGSRSPARENLLQFLKTWYRKEPMSLTTFFQGIEIGGGIGERTLRMMLDEITKS